MTASTAAAVVASAGLLIGASGCVSFTEIPVEIPLQAKIDVANFQRVLVFGFLSGGSNAIDPNTETARLLRSQLRSKQDLKVIDADVVSLVDEVDKQRGTGPAPVAASATPAAAPATAPGEPSTGGAKNEPRIKTDKDLQSYASIFDDKEYWKAIGDRYQSPLIITGTVMFSEMSKSGMVSRPQQYVDSTGITRYQEVHEWADLKGYSLDSKFIFIDGRTGEQLYTEPVHEESLYPSTQSTPALSSYFELMDKVLPSFLNTLSTQKIRGTRILIKYALTLNLELKT
jgi:predicted flap endonuclease-1-like 5' DNA nuclease